MTWVMVIGLAAVAFGALTVLFKAPRGGWEAIGAALLVGIAGFAFQARPDLPGAPKEAAERPQASGEALVDARKALSEQNVPAASQWTVVADAFSRRGQFAEAAGVVRGAIAKDPNNADAWLALANNLVAHADGNLSPAALYAYRRAAQADPQHPGPPFFMGLALAQSGRLDEGRAVWADLLARSPKDAPWRADLEQRLGELDAFIARQNGAAQTGTQ
ncbi:tetratricopeptide repeat protein [Novosphingobium sp.]|uniref:tetratricopeptide repeat protein n=1 Tax=Novosphingobium sp. TaxID=1874826 RepID=UPI0035B41057